MRHYIVILIMAGIPALIFAQNPQVSNEPKVKYYDHNYFLIEGTTFQDSVKENLYDRFPSSYKDKVREPVWSLSKSSAGISVRFSSNSTSIKVRWELMRDAKMNHMAETGIKGIDLYCRIDDRWQFVNTARPAGKVNDYALISNMTPDWREYKMYLPLYDGVTKLEIGIDSLSSIRKPSKSTRKPVVFYGTSITQGGCASRPGMVHTSIISRKLDVDCINFGFSGNGRMEKPVAELISGIDASLFVIECVNNMTPEQIHENAIPLVEIIRSKHQVTPIVFVEGFIGETAYLNESSMDAIAARNNMLKSEYQKMAGRGFKNIYYIEETGGKGTDHEATVDGVHLTDLGFLRYADFLIKKFKRIRLPI
jgi:hypothetical protein